MRSGARTLLLLATPPNLAILRALERSPARLAELRRETGSPAQTTLRAQLKRLAQAGAVEKRRRDRFPGVLEHELTEPGRGLLVVADVLERWLAAAPGNEPALGSDSGRVAVKALAEAWSATILRALAAQPRSLTELNGIIPSLSYPSLERRLAAMREAGLVVARPSGGRGTPYAAGEWTRHSAAPLLAAARWEQLDDPRPATPPGRYDIQALLLLALPLLRLTADASGRCRLGVSEPDEDGARPSVISVEMTEGTVVTCPMSREDSADAWALGTPAAWLGALAEADLAQLERGGDCALVTALLRELHSSLFDERPLSPLT